MFSSLLFAGCFLSVAIAEASASIEAGTPNGAPIAGNYTGPLRPQVHFSPPKGFMNDPNGMFLDADGLYHLYYQCTEVQFLVESTN
jgi:beta-fructofuranosidase